jgi:hypothetical protein
MDAQTMTRDEHREKCIEVMASAYRRFDKRLPAMQRAFDSLHGIARVVPIEATEEMRILGHDGYGVDGMKGAWNEMSAAGDLTNPPEGKP